MLSTLLEDYNDEEEDQLFKNELNTPSVIEGDTKRRKKAFSAKPRKKICVAAKEAKPSADFFSQALGVADPISNRDDRKQNPSPSAAIQAVEANLAITVEEEDTDDTTEPARETLFSLALPDRVVLNDRQPTNDSSPLAESQVIETSTGEEEQAIWVSGGVKDISSEEPSSSFFPSQGALPRGREWQAAAQGSASKKIIRCEDLQDPDWKRNFDAGIGRLKQKVRENTTWAHLQGNPNAVHIYEPSSRQRQKHQINWLAADVANREAEFEQRSLAARQNRHLSAKKYGW